MEEEILRVAIRLAAPAPKCKPDSPQDEVAISASRERGRHCANPPAFSWTLQKGFLESAQETGIYLG
jgi:hypothetical protein